MDSSEFQDWLSAAERLHAEQRREAMACLKELSEAEAKAAVEHAAEESRTCPRCYSGGAVSRGRSRGLRRYQCKPCGRTFNAVTGTKLSGLHYKERWMEFGKSLEKGESIRKSAERCGIAVTTAFRWRHRFLAAVEGGADLPGADSTALADALGTASAKDRLRESSGGTG